MHAHAHVHAHAHAAKYQSASCEAWREGQTCVRFSWFRQKASGRSSQLRFLTGCQSFPQTAGETWDSLQSRRV
ncbi:hypothetical protein EYF80_049634 [Liparis tanakae]|uniref:Uncharacterized protein n=1 Tax=Liparis tanakae TaxID=230148 RepID=A0A4Z2FG42_9TELE|nr:hypothetical protein EYF80_049634 [Liparis tanakae]